MREEETLSKTSRQRLRNPPVLKTLLDELPSLEAISASETDFASIEETALENSWDRRGEPVSAESLVEFRRNAEIEYAAAGLQHPPPRCRRPHPDAFFSKHLCVVFEGHFVVRVRARDGLDDHVDVVYRGGNPRAAAAAYNALT
jgi:hypothetical protein